MSKFLMLFFFTYSFAFAGPRQEVEVLLDRVSHEVSHSKRLELLSGLFLGFPYGKNGPLGEGPTGKYDQDPLYRFDTFDCTTYVETIMALTVARTADEFEEHLNKIRYEEGEIDYLKRNHFTDLQWIPYNIQNGYLVEINQEIVDPHDIKLAQAIINFPGWLRSIKIEQIIAPMATQEERIWLLQELHAEAVNYTSRLAQVPYIAIKTLVARPVLLDRIPDGSVVNFVRPNWDLTEVAGTHQNISHQGFLFRKGKTLYLRHASTTGKVEELPFIDYLRKFQNHGTLKGIHLMKLNL